MRFLKKILKKILPHKVYSFLFDMRYLLPALFFSVLPIQKNKVFITNYYGSDFGDNGKYIALKLLEIEPDIDIVWCLRSNRKNHNVPKPIRVVKFQSLSAAKEMATAKVWIDNCRKTFCTHKREGQFYIQTWHGGPGIKKSEGDSIDALDERYIKLAQKDSGMCDLMISNSTFVNEFFRRACWYNGKILKCGSPRNDILYQSPVEIKQKIKKIYDLPEDCHIFLYAPTFRKDFKQNKYNIDICSVTQSLEKRFGGKWFALLRLHPNLYNQKLLIGESEANVRNVSNYCDMQELLVTADCLITDYSSSNMDYLLTYHPSFVYAEDINEYEQDRGFCFDLKELPFPVATDNATLCKNIENFDEDKFKKEVFQFIGNTGIIPTQNASLEVAKYIKGILNN